MSANDLLKEIYKKFYEQREVLAEAPALTQAPNDASFNFQKADEELAKVISYLMGVPDIQKESFEKAIGIIQEHYKNQPGWRGLLLDYFEYTTEKEKEYLQAQEKAIIKEIEEFTNELLEGK